MSDVDYDEQVAQWEADQAEQAATELGAAEYAEAELEVIEAALATIEAREFVEAIESTEEVEQPPPAPTWQEIALAHGWTPPPKVEMPFTLLLKLGGHEVLHWHQYGIVIPSLAPTGGSFDEAAKIVAGYHRWMPTQYTITDSIIPTANVDWCSSESVLDAIVTAAMTVTEDEAAA